MKAIEDVPTISGKICGLIPTGGMLPTLSGTKPASEERRAAWQEIIDYKLVEGGSAPSRFADDGLEPPTRMALAGAGSVAAYLRDTNQLPPHRVVPNGEGGIVFEHVGEGGLFQKIEVGADGSTEMFTFHRGRLSFRQGGLQPPSWR